MIFLKRRRDNVKTFKEVTCDFAKFRFGGLKSLILLDLYMV